MTHTRSTASPSILTRLKLETEAEHQAVERQVESFLTGDSSSYCSLLQLFLGFVKPAEQQLAGVPWLKAVVPDLSSRMRAFVLQGDLMNLGLYDHSLRRLPRCQNIPLLDTPAQALGYLYVLEGSTLGGQIIARRIEQLDPRLPHEWFRSYGPDVGLMWRHFRASAESYVLANPDHEEAICESARNTFSSLHEWFAGKDA